MDRMILLHILLVLLVFFSFLIYVSLNLILLFLQSLLKWFIIGILINIFLVWIRSFVYKYFSIVSYQFRFHRLLFSFLRCGILIFSCSWRNHIIPNMAHHSFVLGFSDNKIRLLLLVKNLLGSRLLIRWVQIFIICSHRWILISLRLLFNRQRSYWFLYFLLNLLSIFTNMRTKYLLDMLSQLFSLRCLRSNLALKFFIIKKIDYVI
jgi:hypothetical protein